MNRPRIYLAHSASSYGTAHEATCLARVVELLPGCQIVDPSGRYTTDAGWLSAWPRLVQSLDGLVLFTAEDGTIGAGCWREVGDALARSIGLALLDGTQLHELGALVLVERLWRTPGRVAEAVPGRAFEPGEFASLVGSLHRRRVARSASTAWKGA